MKIIDNVQTLLKDDLAETIMPGSKVSIAASYFSIYAYQELKEQLESIDELKFIFTSPSFITEKAKKEKREFYIPRLNRERSLYGTEYEVRLRNELTQKAIARECADWVRRKVTFKSNTTNENMSGFINVQNGTGIYTYMPVNGFTTADIGCEKGNHIYNMITRIDAPHSSEYLKLFSNVWNDREKFQDVTEEVIENIITVYRENSPEFIYFVMLYNIFNEFLEDISEDVLPNEATGFKDSAIWNKLYNFQKDAVLAIINKLEKYNGCILADSVGLGKTYTALGVIKYYENRNKNVLVLCPKKLSDNWNTFKANYVNNPIASDRLRYDVLYHTDLSRISGKSNGLDLERLNWSNYDLVVIDESHNFRNGGETYGGDEQRENRYLRLLNKVIRPGVKTKVLMLSATPVNNRFYDLRNQLALAYEGDSSSFSKKLRINRNIDDVFRNAQRAYNAWCELDMKERTTSRLLQMLDFDFFEVLDSVTIARSRKHIEKFYNTIDIGKFPERMPPITHRPSLTPLNNAINYNEIYELLMHMNLSLYTPSDYIFPSRRDKYMDLNHESSNRLTQAGRERGIQKLMSINLLKRLESSVYSFKLTLQRIKTQIENTIVIIDSYRAGTVIDVIDIAESDDFDLDDQNTEYFTAGKKMKIDLDDMDYKSWRDHLAQDNEILELLLEMIEDITPDYDKKLQTLLEVIRNKIENPINPGNKKIIIFTAFSDTAEYLYDNVSKYVKQNFNLYTAMITGSVDGRTTIPGLRADFNTVLTCFSPVSKEKELLLPNNPHEIDILIATDCISEGQNLQDCDYLTNYDIHWNPVRIIQRFGRIDRIGSYNERIQLVNFWPDITLDDYINLKSRVETRMKISIMTSTGDDDPINVDEKGDLEYRKQQLKRLQEEVVDIEDMSGGVSIMDLGLNEFRLDLLEYVKKNPDLDKTPLGMHAVVNSSEDIPPGVIYVLRNINDGINKENQNRLHPFYIVYITEDGEIASNHLESKKTLDLLRYVCRGETEPIEKAYKRFNAETDDGRSMTKYSNLLQETIESIIHISEESDIDSLFRPGGTTALRTNISGLDDFELICFVVVI